MPRRKKYRRKGQRLSIWETLDWSINPDTTREVIAVILIILGGIFLLGLFNLAGNFGLSFDNFFLNLFGVIGYTLPVAFLILGFILLFPKKYHVKPSSIVGLIFVYILLPALVAPYGGAIGDGISGIFKSIIGAYATILVLAGLFVAALLITFNTSISTIRERFFPSREQVNINEPRASVFATVKRKMGFGQKKPEVPVIGSPQLKFSRADTNWDFPSLDLLNFSDSKASPGNINKNVETIQKTLKDFDISVTMGDVNIGPTVTQYTLKPAEGVKLNQIISRSNDLALALAAHPVRIEAPIPGKSAVGIEVPNKKAALVTLREVLESENFKSATSKSKLIMSLGRDVAGQAYVCDLERMPHLLIAGATGSGKSVCINALIASLLYQNSPADLRLLLIDPKRVEFTEFNGVPHLLAPVITNVDETISALKWAIAEMDRRFKLFAETNRRNIAAYNQNPPTMPGGNGGKLPYIVIIIDELADLMAQAAREVEGSIVRIAQMARATGIHLVVATQRPSVDVITGLIKANITSRIAFAVASQVDSRTILDVNGAERLLGNGDMLFIAGDLGKPKRIQGSMITDKETARVTDFLKREGMATYDPEITAYKPQREGEMGGELLGEDELYNDAKETIVLAGKASASLLQRRLRIGYARAARLLDMLEQEGVIGPADGAKPRDILIEKSEIEQTRKQSQGFGESRYPPQPSGQRPQERPPRYPNY